MTNQETDFKTELAKMSNEKLCEIIVAYRYIGILQDQSVMAMEELANRRGAGSEFQFENHIETMKSSLPKIDMDLNKIFKGGGDMFSGLGSVFSGKKK